MSTTSSTITVTGMGAITPLGEGVSANWQRLCAGDSAIGEIDLFDIEGFRFTQGGQVRLPELDRFEGLDPLNDRLLIFSLIAAKEALDGAEIDRNRTGIILATNFGETFRTESLIAETLGYDPSCPLAESFLPMHTTTRRLAEKLQCSGPATTVTLSCSSGTAALDVAAGWLRTSQVESVIVVGADIISRLAWSGLSALRTMTKGHLCPFDVERSGTLFSEGAAALLLQNADSPVPSGTIELCGWATGNNAHHLTAPAPAGAGSATVMQQALNRANIAPADVGHINAHGTSTKHNDVTESQAIRTVCGDAADTIPVTSIKSMLGHMMGAAGTIEAIATVCALRDQRIPPTINLEQQDPECNVRVVANATEEHTFTTALSNSAGIGGCNAAVAFRRIA